MSTPLSKTASTGTQVAQATQAAQAAAQASPCGGPKTQSQTQEQNPQSSSTDVGAVQAQQVIPPPPPCPGGFIYTVQPGDTLFFIAQRFGVSLQALLAANPQITNPNLIFPGQQICIPPVPTPRPFCPAILEPTPNAPNSMGAALVTPATGHAFLVAHNLPPLLIGVTYTGWIRNSRTAQVIRVDLSETSLTGTWIGLREGTAFVGFNEVFVTQEPVTVPPPATPTGPRLIEGSIAHCS